MRTQFLKLVLIELKEAVNYYNIKRDNLGYEFSDEVNRSLQRIIQYPNAWPSASVRTRKIPTNRFPYDIIYQLNNDLLLIIAIAHQSRKPKYWKERLSNIN